MPFKKALAGWVGLMLCLFVAWGTGLAGKESAMVPAETVVDYIHAVLASDRTFYTVHVVERMQRRGVIESSERWRSESALPLPAQFFQESSQLAGLTGVKVQYRLISFWPINKRNVPGTTLQSIGLGAVGTHPDRSYKGVTKVGDTSYFEAVYADLAVEPRCAGCHNAHPDSPKRDFKLNDVMGAIVVSIQLKQ